MSTAVATNNSVQEFYRHVSAGIEHWLEAGRIVATQLETDPGWADEVHEKHPEISIETIYAFDRIGRGTLLPQLLISDSAGYKFLRRQPLKLQEKCLRQGVDVLTYNNDRWTTLKVDPANLTPRQCRQVFNGNAVRSEAAQRAWIESQNVRTIPRSNAGLPYRIVRRELVIMEPCKLSASELARILSEMES